MKGERHVGGEIRVLSNLIKRCMDDGMPPETTGMQGWIIGFLHRNEDRDMFQRDVEAGAIFRHHSQIPPQSGVSVRFAFSMPPAQARLFPCLPPAVFLGVYS